MATFDDTSTTAANVTHVGGVPPGLRDQTDALAASEALPPGLTDQDGRSGMFGSMTLINVDSGTAYSAKTRWRSTTSRTSLCTPNAGFDAAGPDAGVPPVSVCSRTMLVYNSLWTACDRGSRQRSADARPRS